MNVPTNGRQVLYLPCDGPTDRVLDRTQPRPATICFVHGPECVNLAVLDQNGNTHSRSSVKLLPDGTITNENDRARGGFAMWPERPPILPPAHEQPEPGNADDGTPPDQR